MPTIAIIVPVYKVEPYLHRCVDSILSQTYTDFELILIDDGSPDNCGKICDEYAAKDQRIHVIHQANAGVSAARNAGMELALQHHNIESISFIDSDDWIKETYLEVLIDGILLGADVACASFELTMESGNSVARKKNLGWAIQTPEEYWVNNDPTTTIIPCSKLYKKQTIEKIRFPVGRIFEDVFTTHRFIFAASKIASCAEPIYHYYMRTNSATHKTWTPKSLDLIDGLIEQREYFISTGNPKAAELARGRIITEMTRGMKHNPKICNVWTPQFKRYIERELKTKKLSFWPNRDYYRETMSKYVFAPCWAFHMFIDFLTKGKNSWLATESASMVKIAWHDISHTALQ